MASEKSGSSSSSSLVESLISGDRKDIGGALCNDSQGLCLAIKGSSNMSVESSGVYTNLVHLASKLPNASADHKVSPLITIETENSATLVKEYGDHTIAVRVPRTEDVDAGSTAADNAEANGSA